MSQFISLLALTLRAAAAGIAAETFVTHAGAVPAAGARVLGVTRAPTAAIGDAMTVDALGTAIVLSGAAIAQGAALEVDATGRAITRAAGVTVASARMAATAAGQRIEVLLIPN